jgi:hypothetical protein
VRLRGAGTAAARQLVLALWLRCDCGAAVAAVRRWCGVLACSDAVRKQCGGGGFVAAVRRRRGGGAARWQHRCGAVVWCWRSGGAAAALRQRGVVASVRAAVTAVLPARWRCNINSPIIVFAGNSINIYIYSPVACAAAVIAS